MRSNHQHHTTNGQMGGRSSLERVRLGDVELEFIVSGSGESVLLVHGAFFADWFVPLLAAPSLTDRYRLISYHRVGYAGSSSPSGPLRIADQAAHAAALLEYLGVQRAHVIGHSLGGGNIALQLALDAPKIVQTLALLEAAVPGAPSDAQLGREVAWPALRRYLDGDVPGALDILLRGIVDPDYRSLIEEVLPAGALRQSVIDASTIFDVDLPSVGQWRFSAEDAARIVQPVLLVTGANSSRVTLVHHERHELLLDLLPQATEFVLPEATHLLHVQNPRRLAEALASFFARHPFTTNG